MSVDFNFNNFDFGDYVISPVMHDIVVDIFNTLNRIANENDTENGEVERVSFEPEAGRIIMRATFNTADIQLTDIQSMYSCRLYGGHITFRPENEMEFSVTIVMEGCFDEK